MSTRCQIIVMGAGFWIYKHHDGYPENGVLDWIVPCLRSLPDKLGQEIGSAAKVGELVFCAGVDWCLESYNTSPGHDLQREDPGTWHSDIDYLYVVTRKLRSWVLSICRPTRDFWDNPSVTNVAGTVTFVDPIVDFDPFVDLPASVEEPSP